MASHERKVFGMMNWKALAINEHSSIGWMTAQSSRNISPEFISTLGLYFAVLLFCLSTPRLVRLSKRATDPSLMCKVLVTTAQCFALLATTANGNWQATITVSSITASTRSNFPSLSLKYDPSCTMHPSSLRLNSSSSHHSQGRRKRRAHGYLGCSRSLRLIKLAVPNA